MILCGMRTLTFNVRKLREDCIFLGNLKVSTLILNCSLCFINILLKVFHKSVVETVAISCMIAWYNTLTSNDKKRLSRIKKQAQRIIGCTLDDFVIFIYTEFCVKLNLCLMTLVFLCTNCIRCYHLVNGIAVYLANHLDYKICRLICATLLYYATIDTLCINL